jgi:putative ABC transport system permease protein
VGVLRFAVSGVFRSRRRTLSSALGVILAITFISGTFIAIDSSTRVTFEAILSSAPGDFQYYASGYGIRINGSQLREQLEAVPGISTVSLYRPLVLYEARLGTAAEPNRSWAEILAIDPDHLPWIIRQSVVSGSLELPRGDIALASNVATSAGVGIGSVVRVTNWLPENGQYTLKGSINLTVAAILTPAETASSGVYPTGFGIAAVNLVDADWFEAQVNVSDSIPMFRGEIWIDRARFIDPYNPEGSRENLLRLGRELNQVMNPFGGAVLDNLSGRMDTYAQTIDRERVLFLLLSLPVILLGLYLGAIGADLAHAERRRELGVLKTRGANRRQVFAVLLIEAVLGGLLAIVVGLIAGVVLSRFLLAVVNPAGVGYVPQLGDLFLSLNTLVTVTLLSIAFMALASYRSARRTANLPVVESLRYYAPGETRIHYNPWWDVFEIGYGAAAYLGAFYVRLGATDFWTFLFGIFLIASLPLVPIFLTVGATRLLTRSTGKIYEWTARAFRPIAKDMEFVISRNLSRNPRRASNIAIIIALGLAFGVFMVTFFGSQQAYQERVLQATIGADISVSPPYPVNASFASALEAIPGVAGISEVRRPSATIPWGYASVVGIDPSTYFAVAHPESYYLGDLNAEQVATILRTNRSVLITKGYATAWALRVGDRLSISTWFFSPDSTQRLVVVNTTIAGIVRFLPGTGFSGSFIGVPMDRLVRDGALVHEEQYEGEAVVYGGYETLAPLWTTVSPSEQNNSQSHFLVALRPGAEWHPVKVAIEGLGGYPVVLEEQLQVLRSSVLSNSYLGFIKLEIAFIIVVLTAGLGLIIYAASLERDVEFAAIIARGSSGWQTAGLLVGEAFCIMVIGLVVGLGVGLLTGFFYTEFLFVNPTGGTVEPAVPYLFIFPPEGFLLLAAAAGAMLMAAVIVSWRIARMDVARVLKVRGG